MPEPRKIVAAKRQETRGFLQPRDWSHGSFQPRADALRQYVAGYDVLDIGCASGHRRPDWLHGLLTPSARTMVGVDLDRDAVMKLQAEGHDVRFGDAESVRLDEDFDVVLACEILEHLDCFRGLLETARAHLRPGGRLVLTTPNAFAVNYFIYRLAGEARVNRDHVCWFCEVTLRQLLERNRFHVEEMKYFHSRSPRRVRGALASFTRSLLPEQLAWPTLIAVARPLEAGETDP